jgi:hypothetical protein
MAVITTNPIQPVDQNGDPIPALRQAAATNTQKIVLSGAGTTTAIATPVIRIATDAAIVIEFGAAPLAGTTSLYMPANSVEYFSFLPGDKVGALGTGNMYVTPMA